MAEGSIEIYETEDRMFPPPPDFVAAAQVADGSMYDEAAADFEAFWARQARDLLDLGYRFPHDPGVGSALRQVVRGRPAQRLLQLPGPPRGCGQGRQGGFLIGRASRATPRTITYSELLDDVQRFANVMLHLGLRRGDRIAVYMPMIPELAVTMLACTRIGVAHSVIFGGFSPDAITDRCTDAGGPPGGHRRRRLPPGRARCAEAQRGLGPGCGGAVGGACGGGGPLRHRSGHDRGPGSVVARPDGRGGPGLPG